MRRAINENPIAQIGFMVVLVLVFAILLYTRILSSEEPAEESASADTSAAAPTAPGASAAPTTTPPAEGAVAPDATAPVAPATPVEPSAAPGAFEAGKGLPAPVVNAYEDGKAIVLLVVRQAGIDDKPVKQTVKLLSASDKVRVFVTGAKNVADYSQITNGLSVSQVPALIVIQPQKVSGDVPKASVSYGFRGPESVVQAVEDALYDGGEVPYYPE